jgi:cellobiose phosphorylase
MADWNDCLKLGQRGESVFVAFQLRLGLSTYAEISGRLGRPGEAQWATEKLAELDQAIQKHCWDGEWFVRAFREDGSVIGTRKDEEGSIFLNAQSWAVLSGAASSDQAKTAMNSVKERLATEYGLMLCYPSFRKTDVSVVRATLFNAGMKENGGIFSHPQPWAVMAETMLGRGDRAYEYFRAYMPASYNTRAEVRQVEPYVFCQSTHGKDSRRFGASRLPWLTGAVSWSYHASTHWLLGVRPELDGLRIDPCIPESWDGFEMTRLFRGATYRIQVKNPAHVQKGIKELSVDGKRVEPNQPLPLAARGATVEVVAVMG